MASPLSILVFVVILCVLTEGVARKEQTKAASSYPKFPLFRQCDAKWANDLMGLKTCTAASCPGATIGRDTICHQGRQQIDAYFYVCVAARVCRSELGDEARIGHIGLLLLGLQEIQSF